MGFEIKRVTEKLPSIHEDKKTKNEIIKVDQQMITKKY